MRKKPKRMKKVKKTHNPVFVGEPIEKGKIYEVSEIKDFVQTKEDKKKKNVYDLKEQDLIKREKKKIKKERIKQIRRNLIRQRIFLSELIITKWNKYTAWEKRNGLPIKYRAIVLLSVFLLIYIWGIVAQFHGQLQRGYLPQINFNFFVCFISIFTNGMKSAILGSMVDTVIIALLVTWRWRNLIHKRETIAIERNGRTIFVIVDDGSLATGHEATRDELEKYFTLTTEPHKFNYPIYGIYEQTGEYILGPEIKRNDENRNELVIGAAGSGKSTRNILLKIYKFATRNENMIITDPSSELFKFTYLYLKSLGYEVQVINTRNPYKSNGWNPIAAAGDDFHMIQTMAETIINNATKDQNDPFWPKQQANLLAALIGYSNYKYGKKSNIKLIVNLVSDKGSSPEKLKKMIESTLKPYHPARRCFNNFWNSDNLRGRILNNLGTSLNIFYDPAIAEMLSTSDIHITDFATCEKKAIFIISAEVDLTYSMIPSLFLDMCFDQLPNYAIDNNMPTLTKPLHFICDEFANIGKISEIGQKISVARKYGLILHIVLQDTSRFLQVYGEFEMNTVIGNCWALVVLGIKEQEDGIYFEKMFGNMSVETWQNSTDAPVLDTISQQRTTPQKRPIYFADEIKNMGRDYAMLYTPETNVCKIKKVAYTDLYEYKKFKESIGGTDEDTYFTINQYIGTVKNSENNKETSSNNKDKQYVENMEEIENQEDDSENYYEENEELSREEIEGMWDENSDSLFDKEEVNNQTMKNKEDVEDIKSNKKRKNKKSKGKKIQGLYEDNSKPLYFDYDSSWGEPPISEQAVQLSLEGFKKSKNLEEINKIPEIKRRISWPEIFKKYNCYIYKDADKKIKFKCKPDFPDLYNKQVYVLSFETSADFIKAKLPIDQIRAAGEVIDLSATTHYLMDQIDLPKKYYIDKWTVITNSDQSQEEKSIGSIVTMPNKHITLVPHIALKQSS